MPAWWAFWRRRPTTSAAVEGPAPSRARPRQDEPDEDHRPTPAFSGARPDPATGLEIDLGPEPAGAADTETDADTEVDIPRLREALLDLLQACETGDATRVLAAHERALDLGPVALEVAAFAAVVVLGVQLRVASGYPAGGRPAAPVEGQASAAQGEAVAGRASGLLRQVAPHCSREAVRRLVVLAAGLPQDPALPAQGDVPPADQLLVCCVLTGQALRDGGDPADVVEALDRVLGD